VRLGMEGILPNLEDNIKCGNSLIGPDFYDTPQTTLFDEEEMRRINVFDWNDKARGFGRIMARGGFDCVIGNPPYIKIQVLQEFQPKEVDYLKKKYFSASSRSIDIYVILQLRHLRRLCGTGAAITQSQWADGVYPAT